MSRSSRPRGAAISLPIPTTRRAACWIRQLLVPVVLSWLSACSSSAMTMRLPEADAGAPEAPLPDANAPAAFALVLAANRLPVLQGTSAGVAVNVIRSPGFTEAVTVTASGLPDGTALVPVTVAANETTATLLVSATATAPHSIPTSVDVVGRADTSAAMAHVPLTVTVTGAPGTLDTSFGTGGRARIAVGAGEDMAYAVALQPDGRIVVAGRSAERGGDFSVVRLTRDGALDTSFGVGGKVTVDVNGGSDTAHALALQPDGKVLLAGSAARATGAGQTFALVRLTAAGELDSSFGQGGKVTTAFGADADTAYALLVEPNGDILVGGDSNQGASSTGIDFALARYTSTGALDETFGQGGKVVTALAASNGRDSIYALAAQDLEGSRRIVAVGGEGDFTAARYDARGALDPSFGGAGKVSGLQGSVIGAARAVSVTADGKLLLAGHDNHHASLVQLTPAGALDVTFGAGGKVRTTVSATSWDELQALTLEPSGNIVAAGWAYEGSGTSGNFALLRYSPAGLLDATFGGSGVVVTPFADAGRSDLGMAVALQSDERVPTVRIVTAGYAGGANNDFAVIRTWR